MQLKFNPFTGTLDWVSEEDVSLTSTQIAYGSSTNEITSSNLLTYDNGTLNITKEISGVGIVLTKYSNSTGTAGFNYQKSAGTIASPLVVSSGHTVMAFNAKGNTTGATEIFETGAYMKAIVDGTVTSGSCPMRLDFATEDVGETVATARMSILPNGNVNFLNDIDVSGIVTVGTSDSNDWETAYNHSKNNSQAHSDYLINNDDDSTTGTITARGFALDEDRLLTIGTKTLTHDGTDFVMDDSLSVGGATSGQSVIASGLVVNEDGGNLATDDFRVETYNHPDAFVIDASKDNININTSLNLPYVSAKSSMTLGAGNYQVECSKSSFTINLPTAVGCTGRVYSIKNSGTGTITVDGDGTETIDGDETTNLSQYENLKIMSNGSNWMVI